MIAKNKAAILAALFMKDTAGFLGRVVLADALPSARRAAPHFGRPSKS
ncbi:MAG TPA: hypothetical protein VLK83_13050 [Rhodanobacteraceae bacterium]|nr:hypothetical protein [Rhodanobacteraceae bacterium]